MNTTKKKYIAPSAEQICMAKEDVLTLSDSIGRATFDDGAKVGFDDFN